MGISTRKVLNELPKFLGRSLDKSIHIKSDEPQKGITLSICGEHCQSMITFWSNGKCEIEYVFPKTKKCIINHFEFDNDLVAIRTISAEIRSALQRAHHSMTANANT